MFVEEDESLLGLSLSSSNVFDLLFKLLLRLLLLLEVLYSSRGWKL